jgi:hypothetical protein
MATRVLVQAGHKAPRQPGHLAQTGTGGEIELVSAIQDQLVGILNADDRFEPVAVPGKIDKGIPGIDAAVFLHADGSANQSADHYSFGFPAGFAVNKKLADLIGGEFVKIGHPGERGRDNNTRDMAGYYGYGLVDTPGPEVLIEHGFLTNPGQRTWLFGHVKDLAKAEYLALVQFFGFGMPKRVIAKRVKEPEPNPLPGWFLPWLEWRLVDPAPGKRPKKAPERIPAWAWTAAERVARIAKKI